MVGTGFGIGHDIVQANYFFDGIIDEVRVSRVVRSDLWIAAQQLSMTDSLLFYGPEEPASPTLCP